MDDIGIDLGPMSLTGNDTVVLGELRKMTWVPLASFNLRLYSSDPRTDDWDELVE